MIDRFRRISQDREGDAQRCPIARRPLGRIAQNDQHLGARGLQLRVESPQLGNMGAALHSAIGAHEEEHDMRPAAVCAQGDLAAVAVRQAKVWREIADG